MLCARREKHSQRIQVPPVLRRSEVTGPVIRAPRPTRAAMSILQAEDALIWQSHAAASDNWKTTFHRKDDADVQVIEEVFKTDFKIRHGGPFIAFHAQQEYPEAIRILSQRVREMIYHPLNRVPLPCLADPSSERRSSGSVLGSQSSWTKTARMSGANMCASVATRKVPSRCNAETQSLVSPLSTQTVHGTST